MCVDVSRPAMCSCVAYLAGNRLCCGAGSSKRPAATRHRNVEVSSRRGTRQNHLFTAVWLTVAASAPCRGLHRKVSSIMDSKRIKSDARAHMKAHPGTSYQEALRAVTGDGAQPGEEHVSAPIDLLAAFGITEPDAEDLTRVWERNSGTTTLRAPYAHRSGRGADQLAHLDLIDTSLGGDGAHAALIGPTGYGKSTLLRSLVLALSLVYGPDKVGFVLVDVKGGATFRGMNKLPHVVSVLANLEDDREAQNRLVDFIAEEVDRRQALILGQPNCKDIHEYRQRHHHDPDRALVPLPHMVIVLDEVLTVLKEPSQFRDTLEQLGRVGRALGIHLVLSSQRWDRSVVGGLHAHLESVVWLQTPHQLQELVDSASTSTLVDYVSRYSEARVADELWSYTTRRQHIRAVQGKIDALTGQNALKAQLRAITAEALINSERQRRGLPAAATPANFVFTGAPGTGKTHAIDLLAGVLQAAGITRTASVVQVDLDELTGLVSGEPETETAAAFDRAAGGVLVIDNVDSAIISVLKLVDRRSREALDTLNRLIHERGRKSAVVLCGHPRPMGRLLEREQVLAEQFTRRVEFASPTASELWGYVCAFAQRGGYVVSEDAAEPFQRRASELADQDRDQGGFSRLDRLGNIRFAHSVVEQAARNAANRLQSVDDPSTLSDEELSGLTVEDIVAAVQSFDSAPI